MAKLRKEDIERLQLLYEVLPVLVAALPPRPRAIPGSLRLQERTVATTASNSIIKLRCAVNSLEEHITELAGDHDLPEGESDQVSKALGNTLSSLEGLVVVSHLPYQSVRLITPDSPCAKHQ